MKQNLINDVMQSMLPCLNNAQLEKLQAVMQYVLFQYEITKKDENSEGSTLNLVDLFLSAKRVEGCSEKSLKYYHTTIQAMLSTVNKDIKQIETEDIRSYLTSYQQQNSHAELRSIIFGGYCRVFSRGWKMKIIF